MAILQWILNLGVTVMLPIIIILLGLILRAGVGRSIRSGLLIGVGFTGILLVINLLTSNLGPTAKAMTERLGLKLQIVDIGWPAMASITWAWKAAALVIPICLGINFLMLLFKFTKTLDVDIWNYWQFAFLGAAIAAATGKIWLGLIGASVACIIALLLADYTAPYVAKFFEMPGISFPHLTALGFMPLVIPLNWLLDRIPGINRVNLDAEMIQRRFGIFGEPIMMGLIIGAALGLLAGSGPTAILQLAVAMAAVMYLMPKMVAILMEGLIPISEAARIMMNKRFKGRELHIGLDAAVALGNPSVIAVGLLMVPITIALAFIVPGNQILPFADLAVIPFIVCLITAMSRGNILRSLLVSTIVMALLLIFATNISPSETKMAIDAGVQFPAGATQIGNLDRANLITWALWKFFSLF